MVHGHEYRKSCGVAAISAALLYQVVDILSRERFSPLKLAFPEVAWWEKPRDAGHMSSGERTVADYKPVFPAQGITVRGNLLVHHPCDESSAADRQQLFRKGRIAVPPGCGVYMWNCLILRAFMSSRRFGLTTLRITVKKKIGIDK
jgi:hypothetical protein